MKALGYYVLVKKVKETRMSGGLEMLEGFDRDIRYTKGEVAYVGEDAKEGVKVGDLVYYDSQAGKGITIDDEVFYVLRCSNIQNDIAFVL
jgi:co-chaperonin GroES (HSP10)